MQQQRLQPDSKGTAAARTRQRRRPPRLLVTRPASLKQMPTSAPAAAQVAHAVTSNGPDYLDYFPPPKDAKKVDDVLPDHSRCHPGGDPQIGFCYFALLRVTSRYFALLRVDRRFSLATLPICFVADLFALASSSYCGVRKVHKNTCTARAAWRRRTLSKGPVGGLARRSRRRARAHWQKRQGCSASSKARRGRATGRGWRTTRRVLSGCRSGSPPVSRASRAGFACSCRTPSLACLAACRAALPVSTRGASRSGGCSKARRWAASRRAIRKL